MSARRAFKVPSVTRTVQTASMASAVGIGVTVKTAKGANQSLEPACTTASLAGLDRLVTKVCIWNPSNQEINEMINQSFCHRANQCFFGVIKRCYTKCPDR